MCIFAGYFSKDSCLCFDYLRIWWSIFLKRVNCLLTDLLGDSNLISQEFGSFVRHCWTELFELGWWMISLPFYLAVREVGVVDRISYRAGGLFGVLSRILIYGTSGGYVDDVCV